LAAKARRAELGGPAIIIIGTVVTLRDNLDWRPRAQPFTSAEGDHSSAPSEKDHER